MLTVIVTIPPHPVPCNVYRAWGREGRIGEWGGQALTSMPGILRHPGRLPISEELLPSIQVFKFSLAHLMSKLDGKDILNGTILN